MQTDTMYQRLMKLQLYIIAGDSSEHRYIRIQRKDNNGEVDSRQSSFLRCFAISIDILGMKRRISFKYETKKSNNKYNKYILIFLLFRIINSICLIYILFYRTRT